MSASLAPECNEVKERYDNCFLKWYSEKFLRGTATTDECKPIFEKYEQCLSRALDDRGIDKMLKEVRDDNRENDAEHMKPVSTIFIEDKVDDSYTGFCRIDSLHGLLTL
ncbi:UPF0203-domain-containing protein [Setomelanomma holmii]|uniref:UPF0203-domain-containing protein n=1 Tax=Setomelanomma holmii TaxID=210430 RepID=A0A9P4HGL5_9PLEO|nr:UPF0203-domain-containing protein [Setomelanomma holmii]